MMKRRHIGTISRWVKQMAESSLNLPQVENFHTSCSSLGGLGVKKVRKKQKEPHFYEQISPWQSEDELVETLTKDNLIYTDDNLVVINKPNFVPMGGAAMEHIPVTANQNEVVHFSVRSIFPLLKQAFHAENLQPVYSLSREYSGIMIFVKNEKAFKTLKAYFRHIRTQNVFAQKFWAVTVGTPKDSTSAELFAMKKVKVDDGEVSEKVTEFTNQARKRGEVCVGMMQHKVLDSKHFPGGEQVKVALVELQPTVVKWEGLQCYMTDHCMCPVLGDHVYSPRLTKVLGKQVKLSASRSFSRTQILPYDVTNALEFSSESLVQHTPLHIHLRELVIPDLQKQGTKDKMTLTAPLPKFFCRTLNLLDLKGE